MVWARTILFHSILAALVFSSVWVRGLLLAPDDGLHYFLPSYLSSDRIWDPYLFCGHPAFADPQTMLWYPLRHLPGGLASWNAFVLSGFVLAGAGFHRWIARATKSELAGAVGGIAFAYSGYPMSHLRHVSVLHCAAWFPLLLLALDRLAESPSRRGAAFLAGGLALALAAGHPQTFAIFGLLAGAYAIARGIGLPSRRRAPFARFAAAGFGLGFAAAAVVLAPMIDLAGRSARAHEPPLETGLLPVSAAELARSLVNPVLRGAAASAEARGVATEAFVGFAGAALAAYAAVRGGRRERFLAACVAAGVVLAFGKSTPIGRAALESPLFSLFIIPARVLAISHLAAIALAATAIAALERARRRRAAAWIAAALVTLETAGFAFFSEWRFFPVEPAALERPAFLDPVAATLARTGQRLVPISGRLAVPEGAPPNRSALWEIPTPAGYNPLRGADVGLLFDLNSRGQIPWDDLLGPHLAPDLAATRFVTSRVMGTNFVPVVESSGRWTLAGAQGDLLLFERRAPFERAWLVPEARPSTREAALAAIRAGAFPDGTPFDPRRVALVEGAAGALDGAASSRAGSARPDSAVLELDGARVARVRTWSAQRRLLVVSEAFDAGWRARVDGAPAKVVRTNYLFLGVPLEAGAHDVELVYRPPLLIAGGAVSVAALLGILVLASPLLQRRKSANAADTIDA